MRLKTALGYESLLMVLFENKESRSLKKLTIFADLIVVGGGLSGICAAITAAREGVKVALVQDRPVLGGNASSEVRLWALGATSHMGNNNRWAREGGVIDEILVENLYRNPEGNPHLLDALLLDKVVAEGNIRLLLDTSVFQLSKNAEGVIASVTAFCAQNSSVYEISGAVFCDASGDGILGYLSGASFRIGAESPDEFDEAFAPDKEYGELLGHSMYFFSRDAGHPVKFVPPDFALKDITDIPRYRNFKSGDTGCQLWWLEYGGRLDTVHDSQIIKRELQRVVYGVWNYIKNSGNFPEAENLTLEWVGSIPGKRESRRFMGDYMLSQKDIVEQRFFEDAVSFGGWAIDLHPGDGIYSEQNGCTQWHAKGVYQIPYRTMYSRDVSNLFLAGRIISASHVAFGSTRVMATSAHNAQAVGMAAAICLERQVFPRKLVDAGNMRELQLRLIRAGQYIPSLDLSDPSDMTGSAMVEASSEFSLREFAPDGESVSLDRPRAMLLPFKKGALPDIRFFVNIDSDCEIEAQLRITEKLGNFTPDVILECIQIPVSSGRSVPVDLRFTSEMDQDQYAFICLMTTEHVDVLTSDARVSGILSLVHNGDEKVARGAVQQPPVDIGIDSFEFWHPERRPGGKNLAVKLSEPVDLFRADEVTYGHQRPVLKPNLWVASADDKEPRIVLKWDVPVKVNSVILCFDTDFDHPMESVQLGHPESEIPFCVKDYDLVDQNGTVVYEMRNNHQTRNVIEFEEALEIENLSVRILATHGAPAAIFRIMVY